MPRRRRRERGRLEADDEEKGEEAGYQYCTRLEEPLEARDGAEAGGAVRGDIDDQAGVIALHRCELRLIFGLRAVQKSRGWPAY